MRVAVARFAISGLLAGGLSVGCSAPGSPFTPEQVEAGRGVIYVYQASGLSARPVRVVVDQVVVGTVPPGRYIAIHLLPGEHLVRAESSVEASRAVRVVPGNSEYAEIRATAAGLTIDSPDPETARRVLGRLRKAGAAER